MAKNNMRINKRQKKSQAATEMLIILSVALLILLIIMVANNKVLTGTSGKIESTKARSALDTLATASEMVYQQGVGSRTRVFVSIPDEIGSFNITNQTLSMQIHPGGDFSDIYRTFDFNLSMLGTLPTTEGGHWIYVESVEGSVQFSSNITITPECGNNVKDAGEDCDTLDLGGQTCIGLGYPSGSLACHSNCTYDTSPCPTAPTHTTPILTSTDGSNNTYQNLTCYNQSTNDEIRFKVTNSTTPAIVYASSISDATWYHAAATYNGSLVRIYLNGAEVDSTAHTGSIGPYDSTGLGIGDRPYNSGTQEFRGTVDDVMILNTSLSPTQIAALYQNRTDLIVSQETDINDQWQCEITPNDGSYDGTTLRSNNLTIANNAPDTALVILNSTSATNYTNEDLNCYANITDIDSGNVYAKYTWYKNGAVILSGQSSAFTPSTIALIATLASGNTSRTDNWTCSVNAYDGTDYESDWNNATITILNSLPTHTTPILNSTDGTNDTNQNLTCYPQTTADADSDDIKNIFNWDMDGTSITTLNTPFEGSSNSTWTKDYSGNKNGTVSNSNWNENGGYDGFGAYELPGGNSIQGVEFPGAGRWRFDKDNNYSYFMWVKFNSFQNNWEGIFSYADTLVLQVNTDETLRVISIDDFFEVASGTTTLQTDTWYHIGLTYHDYNTTIYLNGNVEGSGADALIISSSNSLRVGYDSFFGYALNGTIDDFVMYDRLLSPEQIKMLYQNNTDTIISQETIKSEIWQCEVTPNDGTVDGATLQSNNLTILNTAPDTTQVILNSTLATNTSTEDLNCYAQITDADSGNVYANYTWYRNGAINLTGQSSAFTASTFALVATLASGNTSRSDNWTCSVNAYDGTEYESDWNNATITILNSLPTQTTPILNSTDGSNDTDQNLTCYPQNTADADSDDIKNIFNWYKDSASITVLNMPFEGGSTPTNTRDYSPYENNGTAIDAIYNSSGGYDGKGAYQFGNGSAQLINITHDDSLSLSNQEYTIMAWIYPLSFGDNNYGRIVTKGVASGSVAGYKLLMNNYTGTESLRLVHSSPSFSFVDSPNNSIVLNQWQHIAVTFVSGYAKFYINGANVTGDLSINNYTIDSTNPLLIGDEADGSRTFNGTIDEVMIFNTSLSAQQIQALYNNRTDLILTQETTAAEQWQCEITPNDGTTDGTTLLSNNLTVVSVANTAPDTIEVILNSTSATNFTDEDLNCYANITDADGGNVYANYTWYRNGVINLTGQSSAFTSSTISLIATLASGNTSRTDNWTCSVNAYDGTDYESDWNNATINILNSIPTHTTPILNSTDASNDTNQNLTCYPQTTADIDNDNIKNIFNWYKDSTSITVLNMPFEAGSQSGDADGVSNGTRDYSGLGNNGTVYNATYNSTGGYDGKGAYQFDGTTYIEIPDGESLDITEEITVMGWIYPRSFGATRSDIFKREYAFFFELRSSGTLGTYLYGQSGGYSTSTGNVNLNEWSHIATTYNGTSGKIESTKARSALDTL
ncbi:LamG-like jellyroll fold domain-containing protein, partial [Nanoarchaeota archaeon]